MEEKRSRALSFDERCFLEKIAEVLPKRSGDSLRHDIQSARVTQDGDFLAISLSEYVRSEYLGHRNLPFEGEMRDVDGGPMSVLVNMDQNDRLLSVEFIFWNGYETTPDWSTLTIVPEPPMGVSHR